MSKLIGELLVEAKALTRDQLEEVLRLPREPGKKLGHVLLERGLVTEAQLTQCLSLQLAVPWVSLYHIEFSRQLLMRIPREVAERYCLVPIYVRHVRNAGETLYVAMDDPRNHEAIAIASRAAGLPVRPMIGSPSDIRSAIRVYYGGNASGDVEQTPAAPSSAVHDGKAPAPASSDARREPPPLPSKRNRAATDTGASALAAAPAPAGPPLAAGASQAAATAQPSRLSPLPPHAGVTHSAGAMAPAAAPVPTPPPSRPAASPASSPTDATDTPRASLDSPDSSPEIEAREIVVPGKRGARMVALTLLDGTSLTLPTRPRRRSEPPPPPGISEQLTSRDLIAALRALSHGADVAEILGDNVHWEAMFAALLSILLKKGIIADWEFIDELRKI